jgi:hypothetical protein
VLISWAAPDAVQPDNEPRLPGQVIARSAKVKVNEYKDDGATALSRASKENLGGAVGLGVLVSGPILPHSTSWTVSSTGCGEKGRRIGKAEVIDAMRLTNISEKF